ncbi:MAG: GntR family transcriptional regulator [Armatimonadota bacterium]
MELDKNSPLPRHFQLREAIKRNSIRKGMKKGDCIDSERDLAIKYGVSRVTVRRAISDLVDEGFLIREGRRGTFINDTSNHKIWIPNSDKRLIGVLLSNIYGRFASLLLESIEEDSSKNNYSQMLGNTADIQERALENIERFAREGVAGILFVPIAAENENEYNEKNNFLVNQMISKGMQIVFMDRYVEGVRVDTIITDNQDASYKATQHLINQGHRRIAFISTIYCTTEIDRMKGYQKCLMDNGIYPDVNLNRRQHNDDLEQIVDELLALPKPPTAIYAVNDYIATEIWHLLVKKGLSIPDDIALMGYDYFHNTAIPEHFITTTEQPMLEEGKLACQMLIERISGYTGDPRLVTLKSSFIKGKSTSAVAKPIV